MKSLFYYSYKLCRVGIAEEDGAICRLFFDNGKTYEGFENTETPLLKKAAGQLGEYFDGKRKNFDLPLALHGTKFQLTVWKELQKIPYGETRSYGQLAAAVGNQKASRAVGMANNRNPIAIIIPCHRVIGHDGNLTGYAGGLELKRQLLELEKSAMLGRQ